MLLASNRFLSSATAATPGEVLQGPTLAEACARTINQNLRCAVCQNQTIDDANAPFARDHRMLVRERLVLANADEQVVDFIRARHGNFDLLNLPLQFNILALWIGPGLFVLTCAIGFGYSHTDRAMNQPPMPLKAIEQPLDDVLSERSPA
jgi:cytochrome c-type biogenesis protein CcmH